MNESVPHEIGNSTAVVVDPWSVPREIGNSTAVVVDSRSGTDRLPQSVLSLPRDGADPLGESGLLAIQTKKGWSMIRLYRATRPSRPRDKGRYILQIGRLCYHLSAREQVELGRAVQRMTKKADA